MGWHGHLSLQYRVQTGVQTRRTVCQDRHSGPLRVLKSLYPEGDAICHQVLLHPPGGLVGGDSLVLEATLDAGAHAHITTPGAARFYRSDGLLATQQATLTLAQDARLEWLPMETIAHAGCWGSNQVLLNLAPGAEMMGWDLLALGLPASGAPFNSGCYTQQLHWPGVWLEKARIAALDSSLLQSPLGLAGHPVLATFWFAAGQPLLPARQRSLLETARDACTASPLATTSGCTAPDARLVLLRVLAPQVESAMQLLQAVWQRWRAAAWQLEAPAQRLWRT